MKGNSFKSETYNFHIHSLVLFASVKKFINLSPLVTFEKKFEFIEWQKSRKTFTQFKNIGQFLIDIGHFISQNKFRDFNILISANKA